MNKVHAQLWVHPSIPDTRKSDWSSPIYIYGWYYSFHSLKTTQESSGKHIKALPTLTSGENITSGATCGNKLRENKHAT